MDPRAIAAAELRLVKARSAAAELTTSRACAKLAWGEFLLALGGVYSKLEQGAKGSGVSQSWFKGKQIERAADDLLAYLHHARNVEEHGIAPVTKEGHRKLELNAGGMVQLMSDGVDTWHVVGASPGAIKPSEPELMLARVRDRKGEWQPPSTHFGDPIEPTPVTVAQAAIRAVETLVEEARSLPAASYDQK